jgi:PTH1 family peptidyl-tRNA hydrolase
LLLPETYMNRSGESVREAVDGLGLAASQPERHVILVYDDLDLAFGRLRVRAAGGSGGHRGVASVIERLESQEFPRVRIGVGRPPVEGDSVDHVLARFSAAEENALPEVLSRVASAIDYISNEGVVAAMNEFNRAPAVEVVAEDPQRTAGPLRRLIGRLRGSGKIDKL